MEIIYLIIHKHLKFRKVTLRNVTHDLKFKNKQERVRIFLENLDKIREGKCRFCDIIIGNES